MKVKKYIRRISTGELENCVRCAADYQPDDPDLEAVDFAPEKQMGGTQDGTGAYTPPVPVEPDWFGDEFQGVWLRTLTDIAWDQEERLRKATGAPPSSIGPLRNATTKAEYRAAVRNRVKNMVETRNG